MKLILNEKELIRKSLEDGFIDKKSTTTIKLLIKYYFALGMNKVQVRQSIDDFLQKNLPRYNPVKWDSLLDKLIKREEKQKHKLIVIEKVHITKKELDTISNIKNNDLEKLAFTYLVYSKIYNQMNENESNWVNANRSDIFKDSRITASAHNQRLMVNDLISLGLIENSKRRNCGNKKVLFVDNVGEAEIVVSDFREIAYVYLKWKGENIGECECCKKLYKVSGKNHKMCRECWKDREKEIRKEINKKYYSKNKFKTVFK